MLSLAFPKKQPRLQGKEKYGNQKTRNGKYLMDSRAESGLYSHLQMLERMGIVRDIVVKPRVYLTAAEILYIPDFGATECATDVFWHHEMKGFETDVWKIKKRLYLHYGPAPLRVWKPGSRGGPVPVEDIVPLR